MKIKQLIVHDHNYILLQFGIYSYVNTNNFYEKKTKKYVHIILILTLIHSPELSGNCFQLEFLGPLHKYSIWTSE